MMKQYSNQTEVLSFVNGGNQANVVTDGERHKSYEWECVRDHATLKKAIAYLESKGYRLVPDVWEGVAV